MMFALRVRGLEKIYTKVGKYHEFMGDGIIEPEHSEGVICTGSLSRSQHEIYCRTAIKTSTLAWRFMFAEQTWQPMRHLASPENFIFTRRTP